tara:strand:- start:43 stop:468 length:426 start_codon:yes stop_codon:yes gene_type:complete
MTMHLERGLSLLNTKKRKKKPKPLHKYEAGFREHNKFLKKMKLAKMTFEEYVDYVQGKWKPAQQPQQKMSLGNPTVTEPMTRQILPQPKLSNRITRGGTRSWKETRERLEVSKQYSIVPAYNKGPYMVVAREDLKTAGRKV